MADPDVQSTVSMTDHTSSSDTSTRKVHDEDNSNISNGMVTVTEHVNNDHAVGRDAGSEAERSPSNASDHACETKQNRFFSKDEEDEQKSSELGKTPSNVSNKLTDRSTPTEKECRPIVELSSSTTNNKSPYQVALEEDSMSNLEDQAHSSADTPNLQDTHETNTDEDSMEKGASEEMRKADLDLDDEKSTDQADETLITDDPCANEDKEKFNVESLNYELQVGYRILSNMMSTSNRCVNKLFLFPVDDNFPETAAYYEKVKKPMWMFKMKEKFESHQYDDITEFMADFRLMIENCYRFNGPDNFVSKKAQKLETMMKQKVALLSKNLRDKILGASAASEDDLLTSAGLRRRSRNPNASNDDPSQQLLSQLRKDRELQEKVDRRQKVEDRRAMELARLQELQTWEDNLIGAEIKEHIRTMWELPQLGLFVYLCMESLGLEEEVTQYQIERGLAVPRECNDFGRLMTCLLSTPHQRKNLKSFMPYHVWNAKLTEKLDYFYKVLSEKNWNHTQACYKLGLDLRAFKLMGETNPMRKRKFHELTYLKRVWILKNYCDFCLETQQYLQKTIEDIEAVRPNDVREVLLGSDGRGYRYLNFPMFTGKDIRIYKHAKIPEPTLASLCMEDWSVDTEKPSASSSRCSTPINQRNQRQAETPITSLRARALLQAAESKEASPFRDTSRAGSESMDSSSQNPLLDNLESIQNSSSAKPAAVKKRKKTSIFTGKKKRLKIKKTESSAAMSVDISCDGIKEEDASFASASSLNVSACEPQRLASTDSSQKDATATDSAPTTCDTVVQKEKESDRPKTKNILSKDSADSDTIVPSSVSENQSSPAAAKPVPSDKVSDDTSKLDAVGETQRNADCGKTSENILSPGQQQEQEQTSDKQMDSAYLSCESDKSGREEEESGEISSNNTEDAGSHQQPFLNTKNQKCDNSLVHIKEEIKNGLEDEEKKEHLKIKKELSDIIKMEVEEEQAAENKSTKFDVKSNEQKSSINEDIAKFNNVQNDKKGALPNLDSVKKENVESNSCLVKETTPESKTNGGTGDDLDSSKQQSTPSGPMDTSGSAENKTLDGAADATQKLDQTEDAAHSKSGVVERAAEENGERIEEEESDEDESDLPERGRIELVAESMEEMRQLMHKLSNPDPIKRGRKVYPGVIKPCEEELLTNLTRFHDDLLKFEKSLANARAGMQVKLRKEVDSYTEPRIGESKGWDSDHSQSTKDSSEDEEEEEEGEPDSKAEAETGRKSKRIKAKQQVAATTSLLTSAASKLSAISDNGTNEDSNDSFELDISSRGRLRKRRIIPNNTEDTGLRKRKLMDAVTSSDAAEVSSSTVPLSSAVSTVTHPPVIQRQPGKPWPSHILSMLTSGGLAVPSTGLRAQLGGQLMTSKAGATGLQQHMLAGQVFRLVTPGADGSVRALQASSNVSGARGLHAAPGSVIISPQNLASIRFVSSTGVVTLPREKILSAGSSSGSSTTLSSSPAQASHPVIQQLLLNKSAKAQTSPSKVTFVPNVSAINGGLTNQGLPGSSTIKRSVIVTLPAVTSTITLHHTATAAANRPTLLKPPMVMVTPQNAPKIVGGASGLPGAAGTAAPVVVSHVSSSMSGGKQVLDLGSLSVTQIQQLMRNQAIQINMGGAGSGPTTLLLTTGLQQLGANANSSASVVGNTNMAVGSTAGCLSGVRLQQQQPMQQIIRPPVAATGASALLAMINSKGQKLVNLPAASTMTCNVITSTIQSGHQAVLPQLVDGQLVIKSSANAVATTSLATTNPALKSVLGNRAMVPQSVLAGKILTSSVQNRMALGPGATIISANSNNHNNNQPARITLPMPQIISSLSASVPAPASAATITTVAIPQNPKTTQISTPGKDNGQQKARTIITVPLVHLSSAGKKYASNVTVKALLENRAPKKPEDENGKNTPQNSEAVSSCKTNTVSATKALETYIESQAKENESPAKETVSLVSSQSASQAMLASITKPLSVNTSGLECATSEVIVPTVHIKVPSPNTLPSVLHNKNGTTIVQSTKVPIAVASEAKAPETAVPNAGNSLLSGEGNVLQSVSGPLLKSVNVLPAASASLASTTVTASGANLQQAQQQQAVKNVMLKVTPQSGGSGQFVQGFMTSRGLVIPQSALVQQQQAKNVILANGTSGNSGQMGGQQPQGFASLPVQQAGTLLTRQQTPGLNQAQNPLQVMGTAQNSSSSAPTFPNQVQKGTVISSGGLKFMLVNPVAQGATALPPGQASSLTAASNAVSQQVLAAASAQQPQTSTPAAELVKQIAANSIQVQSTSQAGILGPPQSNTGLGPRLVQKSNMVMRAQPGVIRMSAPVVVSSNAGPRASGSVVQQPSGILSGQTVINSNVSPSNINPQLAAQILALQHQQQQQGLVVAGGKPAAVGQQLQQQAQPGTPSVVTLQLQQLGQLFSSLTQLQPGGVQQQQQQQAVAQSLAGGQQQGQVVQLSLNPGQTLLSGASHPQTPQIVKVAGGQVSPQIQLANGQLQSSQGPGLVLHQTQAAQLSSQNLLVQQKPIGPSSAGSISLQQQPNALQPLLNPQQGQAGIMKLPQQAGTITVKPQMSVAPSLPSPQPALQVLQQQQAGETNTISLSNPSTPVSLSPSQGFVVSPAGTATLPSGQQQQQVQFVLNPSSLSIASAGNVTGVSSMAALNKLPGGSIRRVIRADSSLLQSTLTTSAPTVVQAGNMASPGVVIGGPNHGLNSNQLTGNKQGLTQMLLPTSGSAAPGQILISPMKLGASPQANLISPLKLLGGLQVANSAAATVGQGTQILMNTNQLPGTILGKPSVIYAGQPAQLQGSGEKMDGNKMQQILPNQSNGNLLQANKIVGATVATPVLNSQGQFVLKSGHVIPSPAATLAAAAQLKQLPGNKNTYLYKVGEQYFSPSGPVAVSGSQLNHPATATSAPSGSALLPSNLVSSKADVQLLVPPACIEASEKIILQSTKNLNVNAPSSSNKLHQLTSTTSSQMSRIASTASSSNLGAVNGTSFSFSLSGPMSLDKPQSDSLHGGNAMIASGAPAVLLGEEGGSKAQLKHPSGIPTNGGDAASLTAANHQQPVVKGAATGDEEEAALNLLTLANQAV